MSFTIKISPTQETTAPTATTPETAQTPEKPMLGTSQEETTRTITITDTKTTIVISEELYNFLSMNTTRTDGWTADNGLQLKADTPKTTWSPEFSPARLFMPRAIWSGKRCVLEELGCYGACERKSMVEAFPRIKEALTQAACEAKEYYAKKAEEKPEDLFAGTEVV